MKKNEKISRTDALKKIAKYSALTSISTFLILNPKKAQAFSGDPMGSRPGKNDIWKD